MLEVRGNDIYRAGVKIGWVLESRVYNHEGKEVGYFTNDSIFDLKGELLARVSGNYVYFGSRQTPLDDILSNIEGVGLSNAGRVAIITFLGE